jgi:DNA-binding SARP family transcriptional activator
MPVNVGERTGSPAAVRASLTRRTNWRSIATSPRLAIRLLGKPALELGGSIVPFGQPPKAFAMLAYLIVHRDRPVKRQTLGALFWPDDDEKAALANVRRYLHRIGLALPDARVPYILSEHRDVRWNSEASGDVDVIQFERALSERDVGRAAAAYRGDFLEGFDDEWIFAERERLRGLLIANLIVAIEAARLDGRLADALRLVQKLTQCDPLREDAVRQAMLLRFESGDRSGALAEFEAFERRLEFELGAQPMRETRAVYEALRLGKAPPGMWASPQVVDPSTRRVLPFVGRADALAELRGALDRAARGSVRFALVTGEAGIGKTRLLSELVSSAQTRGVRVAVGSTSPIESEPYQVIASALRSALPYLRTGELGVGAAALATLIPEIRDRDPHIGTAPRLDAERERTRLFESVRDAFAQLGKGRPALIAFEDLHWAQPSTLEEIRTLASRLSGSILIVMTVRDDDPGAPGALRLFERVAPPDRAVRLPLRRLDVDDIRALVVRLDSAEPDPDVRARELFTRSDGNPLFLAQVIGGASKSDAPTVSALVAQRIDALSERGRRLLENAAVIGLGFEVELLRSTSAWSVADVLDGLDELLDAALVRESVGRRGDFAFSHHLVHQAAYRSIDATALRRLHRRAARALESFLGVRAVERAATIARHYDEAATGEAVGWYETAAQRALTVFANNDAIALASRGLELAESARARFALLGLRETALGRLARRDEQKADCLAMLATAREEAKPDWEWESVRRAVDLAAQRGDSQEESASSRRLRELAEAGGDPRRTVEAATLYARWLVNAGRTAESLDVLSNVEDVVSTLGDPSTEVEYWWGRLFAESALRKMADAEASLVQMNVAVKASGRKADPRAFRAAATVAMQRFDADALMRTSQQALEVYGEAGDVEGTAWAHQHLALAAMDRFDIKAQRLHLGQAMEVYCRIGKPTSIYTLLVNRGFVAVQLGLFNEAKADFISALELGTLHGKPDWIVNENVNLANVALMQGEYDCAKELAIGVLSRSDVQQHPVQRAMALEALGIVDRHLGELASGTVHLEAAARAHREMQSETQVGTLEELIVLHLAAGRVKAAIDAADELAPLLRAKPSALPFPTVAYARIAEAYRSAGRHEEARSAFESGRALFRKRLRGIPDAPTRRAYAAIPGHEVYTTAPVDALGTLAD